jgi:hypothetical protein
VGCKASKEGSLVVSPLDSYKTFSDENEQAFLASNCPSNALPPQIAPQKSATSMQMLARVVTNWGAIPPQIQQAIVAIVENCADTKGADFEM